MLDEKQIIVNISPIQDYIHPRTPRQLESRFFDPPGKRKLAGIIKKLERLVIKLQLFE